MKSDETLDVKGKTCPMPVLLAKKKIKTIAPGIILEIIGDFPPAKVNLQNFLITNGHEVLEIQEKQGIYRIYTKIKGQ
jgi:tRNA 2-thiouridine synthesizing protein A